MTAEQRRDRYLRLARWAARRYTRAGVLLFVDHNRPTPYARIEQAAWDRYLTPIREEPR